jgi:integrase
MKLSNAIELWMAERGKEGLGERELRRIRTYVELLLAVVGDKQVHTIKRQQANAFKDTLTSSDKSVTTINNYLKRAKALFDWLATRYDDLPNPFLGLRVKQSKAPAEQRKAFSLADLNKLESEAKHLPAYKRWIFDIARYTGMRQNEICQLYKDDIRQVDGVWCFRVTDSRPDQQLKSSGSRRLVPISTNLLERGIIDFAQGAGRLFPELTNSGERGYARYFQKWYSNWKKPRGLPDFHSLRHTVATRLKSAGIPEQYAAQLLGHAAGGITYNRYGKDVPIRQLVELVELL